MSTAPSGGRPNAAARRRVAALALALVALAACSADEPDLLPPDPVKPENEAAPRDPTEEEATPISIGGGIHTDEDLAAALRRAALSLPEDDPARILRVLEEHGASPVRPDPERVARVSAALRRLLSDEDPYVRRGAVALFGRMAPGDAPDLYLVTSVADPERRVRREVVRALAARGPAAHADLLVRLTTDAEPQIRRAAAAALSGVQTPAARNALLTLLADPDNDVVRQSGESLAVTLNGAVPDAVIAASKSERPICRIAATRVLAAMGAPETLPALRVAAGDPVWEVRRDAIRGLGVLPEPHAAVAKGVLEDVVRDRSRPRTDRFEALQAMVRTPLSPDLDLLDKVARTDDDNVIRMMAARTLLARGDVRGLRPAVDLLLVEIGPTTDDEDRIFIRETSATMLGDVAGGVPDDGSYDAWTSALPRLEKKLAAGFEYMPERLTEFW